MNKHQSGQFYPAGESMGLEVAKQEPPVIAEIYSLEKAINYLRENIALLEERLSPVLQETPPSTEGLSRDMHGESPLCRHVYQMQSEVGYLTSRIRSLLDRLEV